VEYVVDRVARGRMFLQLLRFSPFVIIPQAPYSFLYLLIIGRIFNTSLVTKYEVILLFSYLIGWLVGRAMPYPWWLVADFTLQRSELCPRAVREICGG
jgi:hypothetical protein